MTDIKALQEALESATQTNQVLVKRLKAQNALLAEAVEALKEYTGRQHEEVDYSGCELKLTVWRSVHAYAIETLAKLEGAMK